ncbi:hypothetical protein VA596_18080 [Amycolatopsis sp., V23-08]|uniref:Phenylalanyl-tRNA synthetase domain-containing protein n=1 Tax=Amycolatopsis heterodermiae TaxID=3110235 RepID=A0ABU5R743_9PSEU|nr:hypothetical protein [Amycolatopsis sp., V23-08]MEA5361459.1 hypothetical protein [Amycolatopsis sp., V23-08]
MCTPTSPGVRARGAVASTTRATPGTPRQLDLWRLRDRPRPYTVDGARLDVEHDGAWVEVAECGLASPAVLARAGLALGMGLDRMLMLLKCIPDIRLLRSAAPTVADQMLDLEPCRPVPARSRSGRRHRARTCHRRHWPGSARAMTKRTCWYAWYSARWVRRSPTTGPTSCVTP